MLPWNLNLNMIIKIITLVNIIYAIFLLFSVSTASFAYTVSLQTIFFFFFYCHYLEAMKWKTKKKYHGKLNFCCFLFFAFYYFLLYYIVIITIIVILLFSLPLFFSLSLSRLYFGFSFLILKTFFFKFICVFLLLFNKV